MAKQGKTRGKALPRGAPVPTGGPRLETLTVTRLDQLKALSHPLRQQLFEQFAHGARTTKQVADHLGEKLTRLYHHVAALEDAGLIELVATRPVRGTIEKYYEAVARTVRIDSSLLAGDDTAAAAGKAALDVVDGVLGKVRRDVATLLAADRDDDGQEEEVLFVPVDIAAGEEDVRRVRAKLDELLAELRALGDAAPEGMDSSHRLLIGWYPVPGAKRKRR